MRRFSWFYLFFSLKILFRPGHLAVPKSIPLTGSHVQVFFYHRWNSNKVIMNGWLRTGSSLSMTKDSWDSWPILRARPSLIFFAEGIFGKYFINFFSILRCIWASRDEKLKKIRSGLTWEVTIFGVKLK